MPFLKMGEISGPKWAVMLLDAARAVSWRGHVGYNSAGTTRAAPKPWWQMCTWADPLGRGATEFACCAWLQPCAMPFGLHCCRFLDTQVMVDAPKTTKLQIPDFVVNGKLADGRDSALQLQAGLMGAQCFIFPAPSGRGERQACQMFATSPPYLQPGPVWRTYHAARAFSPMPCRSVALRALARWCVMLESPIA